MICKYGHVYANVWAIEIDALCLTLHNFGQNRLLRLFLPQEALGLGEFAVHVQVEQSKFLSKLTSMIF